MRCIDRACEYFKAPVKVTPEKFSMFMSYRLWPAVENAWIIDIIYYRIIFHKGQYLLGKLLKADK
jgi:hypothetical protein